MAEQQFVQQQPIFTNALQFAEAQQIGTIVKEYKSKTVMKLIIGISLETLAGILILSGLLMAVIIHDFNSIRGGLALAAIGCALMTWGIYLTGAAFRNKRARIYLGSDGLMRVHRDQAVILRWDQVVGVQRNYIRSRTNYFLHAYTLVRRDGSSLAIEKSYKDFKDLGKAIEDEVTRHLLPLALDRYKSGQPTLFGVIVVDTHGITVLQKKEPKTLPWNELAGYKIYDGRLKIMRQSSRSLWQTVLIPQIPNLCVLLAFIERITHEAPSANG